MRKDLARRVQRKLTFDISINMIDEIIGATLDTIKAEVSEKGRCRLRGFGTFKLRQRDQYKKIVGGKETIIPARALIRFSASRNFVDGSTSQK